MDTPVTLADVLLVIGAVILCLIIPQTLGFAGYRWALKRTTLTKAATTLIAPLAFFISTYTFWGLKAKQIEQAGNRACGIFGMVAVFSTLAGTAINFILGIVVCFVVTYLWRRKNKLLEQGTP